MNLYAPFTYLSPLLNITKSSPSKSLHMYKSSILITEQLKSEDYVANLLGNVRFANNNESALLLIDNKLN